MGAALSRAVELSLELKKLKPGYFEWKILTSTVNLIDDVKIDDESDNFSESSRVVAETRKNSSIHICITKLKSPSS